MKHYRIAPAVALLAVLSACSSSDSYDRGNVSMGGSVYYGHAWYDDPYYWNSGPGYVVVAPPYGPGYPNRPVPPVGTLPDRPTTLPSPVGPTTKPAQRPATSGTRPAPAPSSRSRMPAAQPRVSSPSARPSIPSRSMPRSMPRGGGGRGRR
jgi:hypothetical protein